MGGARTMARRIDVTGADGVRLAAWEFADPPKDGADPAEAATRSAPGVLLLHGLMGRASHWASTARWLSARYRAVALDQRGHGRSDKPAAGFRSPATPTSTTPKPPSTSSASAPPSSSATPWARSPPGSSPPSAPTWSAA